MTYVAPIEEMLFLLENICDVKSLQKYEKYSNLDGNTIRSILSEVGRLSSKIVEPVNRLGDLSPPQMVGEKVVCSPGFFEAYKAIADGGWVGMSGNSEFGGMDLPLVITSCVNEMLGSACLSLSLNSLMTQGQIEALENHGSIEIKKLYLPHLNSGRWSGTMNLTEENAGSDVGALKTRAIPVGDGTYEITGEKIYISWGEHDLTENICHLVLARLPNSATGTKGISLFLVPKYIPNEKKNIGEKNTLRAVSLEEKMGLHGSPTAIMQYNKAKGWLIGKPNTGMKAMFTMMNNARLGVGVQGLSQAEHAFQKALQFAKKRKQGQAIIKNGSGTIIDHADVRRNLLLMKSLTIVCRYICLDTALSMDLAKVSNSSNMLAKAEFLIPIAKAFSTDMGCRVCDIGIQVHGGIGFIEGAGASQLYRDARITTIYEGTNGIQAIDLVNRKLSDNGVAAFNLIDEFIKTEEVCVKINLIKSDLIEEFKAARMCLSRAIAWMLNTKELNDKFAGATPFLKAFGLVLGAHYLLKAAIKSQKLEKIELAQFYIHHILPETYAATQSACRGSDQIYAAQI